MRQGNSYPDGADYEILATDVPSAYERGNQYLDRALLVDTLATTGCGFFS